MGGWGALSLYIYQVSSESVLSVSGGKVTGIDVSILYDGGAGGGFGGCWVGCMSVRISAYISSWSVSIWRVAYVWSIAACGAFVMMSVCIIIWSSALPESLFHLVMYGVLG